MMNDQSHYIELWNVDDEGVVSLTRNGKEHAVPGAFSKMQFVVKPGTVTVDAGAEEFDVIIQTATGRNGSWRDLANVHWENPGDDATTTVINGLFVNGTANVAAMVTTTLADDTVASSQAIGTRLRVRAVPTSGGTASFNVEVWLTNN